MFTTDDEILHWRITDREIEDSKHSVLQNIKAHENKNTLVNSPITAGGDVKIGDTTYTETKSSRNLRFFLFLFIPVLAIAGAWFWYQNQVLQNPFSLRIALDNQTSAIHLPEPEGVLSLILDEKTEKKRTINQRATFEGIHPKYKEDPVRLQFEAEGFEKIDSSFIPENDLLLLPVKRDDSFALITGSIYLDGSEPLEGLEGVKVAIGCCSDYTDASGEFRIEIPFEHQREEQTLELSKEGFYRQETTEPVIKGVPIKKYLIKK